MRGREEREWRRRKLERRLTLTELLGLTLKSPLKWKEQSGWSSCSWWMEAERVVSVRMNSWSLPAVGR